MEYAHKLRPEIVNEIFMDCLFNAEEDTANFVKAEGIVINVGFHPGRLAAHKEQIAELLAELPAEFQESTGGGMSFLNACNDKYGQQWGEHQQMEQLFQLGVASGLAKCLLPRKFWPALPGGMPYYVVLKPLTAASSSAVSAVSA
jgi:hypothetical protein